MQMKKSAKSSALSVNPVFKHGQMVMYLKGGKRFWWVLFLEGVIMDAERY